MIRTDIFKVLSESVAIANIASTRIYPMRLPERVPVPAIVYSFPNISPIKSLDGEIGIDSVNIEITCWAKSYLGAHILAGVVRSEFSKAGIGMSTDNMQDMEDEETMNYGIVLTANALTEATIDGWGNAPWGSSEWGK